MVLALVAVPVGSIAAFILGAADAQLDWASNTTGPLPHSVLLQNSQALHWGLATVAVSALVGGCLLWMLWVWFGARSRRVK